MIVVPAPEVEAHPDIAFLAVGRSGVDGIEFGYRKGVAGLWAYPVDGAFVYMAPTIVRLVSGWSAGELHV